MALKDSCSFGFALPHRSPDPIDVAAERQVAERSYVARAELQRWFTTVYRRTESADALGLHGTPEQLRAGIQELLAIGANHLLLNPVCRHAEQLEALAEIIGLR